MLKTFAEYLVIGTAVYLAWYVIGPAIVRFLHL